MTGVIFDIKRFAVHDGPGIRTTVFLKGCPMRCKWCHNPESWHPDPCCVEKKVKLDEREFTDTETVGKVVTVKDVMTELEKERLVIEESHGGVTFSGGEPLMQPLFLKELLSACTDAGFHTAVDTSGYGLHSDLEQIIPLTDLFLYDLKLIDPLQHERYTGVSNEVVLSNFSFMAERGKTIRIRIPVIRGITGTTRNMEEIADFLAPYCKSVQQVDLLPFHRTGMNKYSRLDLTCEMPGDWGKPAAKELDKFRRMFEKEGYKVHIGG